ncbi:MAG: alpha-N-arabinofuranosidase [Spirochaetes bacterium]|nr:alpha-N-arabinofuranosidase [Spirochaetota bacterium]
MSPRPAALLRRIFDRFAPRKAPPRLVGRLTLHRDQIGKPIPPHLYGLFFEDINGAADGGLYAELVENRSFAYFPIHGVRGEGTALSPKTAWETVGRGKRECRFDIAILDPVDERSPNYAVLRASGGPGSFGIANRGYRGGMRVEAGAPYDFSAFIRSGSAMSVAPTVALEGPDGQILARETLAAVSSAWEKREAVLIPRRSESRARLVVTLDIGDAFHLAHVSLFPRETFHGRRNGLRKDLAQAIADLKPRFLRFPGGCIVHGDGLANAYRWKDSVGPIESRRPNWNRWGYHQTYGLGFFEYFQFCEDIGCEPMPILPAGVSCGFSKPFQAVGDEALEAWIQDCVDLVAFANGPASSGWGAVRAAMGHPEPFGLKLLGVGNEEHDTPAFRKRFPKFVERLRRECPGIEIIGTSGLGPEAPLADLMAQTGVSYTDEHYYMEPAWFVENHRRFDGAKREGPKVYVGEYASRGNAMENAVAEAVYLTGLERNSDLVAMHSYAPLLAHYDFCQWKHANLIWFDDGRVVTTPNYHVQRLFASHLGETWVPHDWNLPPRADGRETVVGVSSTYSAREGALFLKFANPQASPVDIEVDIRGGGATTAAATRTLLAGPPEATNDLAAPNRVAPVEEPFQAGPSFSLEIPPCSVVLLRIPSKSPEIR